MSNNPIRDLSDKLRQFARERDWEQFHTPKNLATALVVEAAELAEHFQWLRGEESANLTEEKFKQVAMEMGDVFIYLIRLADILGVDLIAAAEEKMSLNAARYPADKVRGKALKYKDL
ncbi:MAG: nucleotide pyrophosphohydrolase [Betaproteobacteria bacterium]|nr:nucleotide pyrophosphohydrolase [Betaproteobacteria bacterium]MBI2959055.1 nucleotide pyrophosphohydrolase [Betaproteobacteria bacterium]